ncbi:MAG: substrate-binding domain-containing protein [Anaerolineales bacterium]
MGNQFHHGIFFIFFTACVLSGCRGAGEQADIPHIPIAVASALEPAATALLKGFSGIQPQGGLLTVETMADKDITAAFAAGGISAAIQWQEPPAEEWSALIGWTGIIFAVHPDNPVRNLSAAQARAIFSGFTQMWEEAGGSSGEIHAFAFPAESPWAALFEGVVLTGGRLTTGAMIVPSVEAMPAAVAGDPQSIGYMMMLHASPGVRILTVDGVAADYPGLLSGAYPFRIPIFLRAREPVSADILTFAGWAQSVSGQAVLMELQSRE